MMTLKEILARIRQMDDAEFVNNATGYLENLQTQADEASGVQRKLGNAQAELEKLTAAKNEATNDAVAERKQRQQLQTAIKPFIDAGLVDGKDYKPALDGDALAALKESGTTIKELQEKLNGYQQADRQRLLQANMETIFKDKGYTSGIKVLLRAAEQKGDALDPEDTKALETFVAENVAELGEEIFTVESKGGPKGGDQDAAGGGDAEPGKGDAAGGDGSGKGGSKKIVTPQSSGHSVTDPGGGRPNHIAIGEGAGISPENVPTFAEYVKQEREGQNLTVPRAVSMRTAQADAERQSRSATTVGKGADDKPIADITPAVK